MWFLASPEFAIRFRNFHSSSFLKYLRWQKVLQKTSKFFFPLCKIPISEKSLFGGFKISNPFFWKDCLLWRRTFYGIFFVWFLPLSDLSLIAFENFSSTREEISPNELNRFYREWEKSQKKVEYFSIADWNLICFFSIMTKSIFDLSSFLVSQCVCSQ